MGTLFRKGSKNSILEQEKREDICSHPCYVKKGRLNEEKIRILNTIVSLIALVIAVISLIN